MSRVLILSARRYEFTKDNRHVSGVELNYVTPDGERSPQRQGHAPMRIQAPASVWEQLVAVPGHYELEYRQKPGRDGKPEFAVAGAAFVRPASIWDPYEPSQASEAGHGGVA